MSTSASTVRDRAAGDDGMVGANSARITEFAEATETLQRPRRAADISIAERAREREAPPRLRGLSETEVLDRRGRGHGNDVAFAPSRSYLRIVRDNAFSSINLIIFGVGVALTVLGLFGDALVTVGLVLLNVAIATIQETRSKRALDRIALLTRPQATVIRDGQERQVDPEEIVLGDILAANAGDQIVVDGRVVGNDDAEIDEALLSGESEPVANHAGRAAFGHGTRPRIVVRLGCFATKLSCRQASCAVTAGGK